jgi:membrane protease YdiL (CAAX protease family)
LPGENPKLIPEGPLSTRSGIRQNQGRIRDAFLALAGVLLFAGFIHRTFPLKFLAIGGLLGTAAVIVYSTRKGSLREAFGISSLNQRVLLISLAAIGLGILLGIWTRRRFELTLIPAGLTGVAIVAPLVGAAEELLFRGYFQGHLRPAGRTLAVVSASAIHTSYKLLVILSLAIPMQFDFFFLIFWTFIGGLLFGILREASAHVLPSLLAHAAFDIILYGMLPTPPAWVWS